MAPGPRRAGGRLPDEHRGSGRGTFQQPSSGGSSGRPTPHPHHMQCQQQPPGQPLPPVAAAAAAASPTEPAAATGPRPAAPCPSARPASGGMKSWAAMVGSTGVPTRQVDSGAAAPTQPAATHMQSLGALRHKPHAGPGPALPAPAPSAAAEAAAPETHGPGLDEAAAAAVEPPAASPAEASPAAAPAEPTPASASQEGTPASSSSDAATEAAASAEAAAPSAPPSAQGAPSAAHHKAPMAPDAPKPQSWAALFTPAPATADRGGKAARQRAAGATAQAATEEQQPGLVAAVTAPVRDEAAEQHALEVPPAQPPAQPDVPSAPASPPAQAAAEGQAGRDVQQAQAAAAPVESLDGSPAAAEAAAAAPALPAEAVPVGPTPPEAPTPAAAPPAPPSLAGPAPSMHAASVAPPVPAFFGMVGPPVPTRPPGASPHGFMFSRGPGIMQWHEQLAVHAPPLHPEALPHPGMPIPPMVPAPLPMPPVLPPMMDAANFPLMPAAPLPAPWAGGPRPMVGVQPPAGMWGMRPPGGVWGAGPPAAILAPHPPPLSVVMPVAPEQPAPMAPLAGPPPAAVQAAVPGAAAPRAAAAAPPPPAAVPAAAPVPPPPAAAPAAAAAAPGDSHPPPESPAGTQQEASTEPEEALAAAIAPPATAAAETSTVASTTAAEPQAMLSPAPVAAIEATQPAPTSQHPAGPPAEQPAPQQTGGEESAAETEEAPAGDTKEPTAPHAEATATPMEPAPGEASSAAAVQACEEAAASTQPEAEPAEAAGGGEGGPSPPAAAPAGPKSWADRARAASVAPSVPHPKPLARPPQRLPGKPPAELAAPAAAAAGAPGDSHHPYKQYHPPRGRGYGGDGGRHGYSGGRGRGHHATEEQRREHQHGFSAGGRASSHGGSPRHRPPARGGASAGSFYPAGLVPSAHAHPSHPAAAASEPARRHVPDTGSSSSKSDQTPTATELVAADGSKKDPLAALAALCTGSLDVAAAVARLQPRGIINPGHHCFANCVVQALMGSTGFCSIMTALGGAGPAAVSSSLPTLSALAALVADFPAVAPSSTGIAAASTSTAQLLGGQPLLPAVLIDVINRFRPHAGGLRSLGNGGLHLREQEDAHDFLEYLLDRMHQELLQLGKLRGWQAAQQHAVVGVVEEAAAQGGGDGWLVQSGKRVAKRQEHRAADDAETAVSVLFRGRLLSTVTCQGQKPSETSQPFLALGLHILSDPVRSVADALDLLTAGETVHDYKPNDAAPATTATKTVRLQRLPRMLVLYLMRFDPASLNKVAKHVSFEPRLAMRRAWLTPDSQDKRAEYQLVATVSHHGRSISSGHYTADVLQPDGKFLRFDDDTVSSVSLQTVLSERVYLLFYARQN